MIPKILLYNLSSSKGFKIEKLCKRLHIEPVHIKKEEYGYRLGYLCGLSEEKAGNETKDAISEEMLVMAGFTEELLEKFLKEYRLMHIEPILLKAVLTESNKEWASIDLYKELVEERNAYEMRK